MDDPRNPKDNNTSTTDKAQRPDDDTNPFISFRRYADDQIHSLMNSVMGIPATLSKEHDRWHASRQHGDQQVTGTGKEEVWVKQWSNEKRGHDDDASRQQDDPSRCVKVWRPDGHPVKPEVTEDANGGKTWHWSTSWSWPPKNNGKRDGENSLDDLDTAQRKALDEARRNADKEMQELTDMFKGFFGVEDNKQDVEQPARPQSILDWVWPGHNASAENHAIRREVEEGIKWLEDLGLDFQNSVAGFGRAGPWSNLRISDEAHEGSQIFRLLDRHHFGSHQWGWGNPLAYFLDYSNPRTRWVLGHPYSPAVLEADAIKKGVSGPRYVDAFEDLMRAEGGIRLRASDRERIITPPSYRLLAATYGSRPGTRAFWQNVEQGGEWYVPEKQQTPASSSSPGQKQLEAPTTPDATTAANDMEARDHMYERFLGAHTADPKTELDMYERFLGDSSAHHHRQPPPEPKAPAAKPTPATDIDVSASPILSTVTTTERNVAADGTVTTKVTLKKRFADGREESSETVNTARGDANQFLGDGDGKKKSGGWFWSN